MPLEDSDPRMDEVINLNNDSLEDYNEMLIGNTEEMIEEATDTNTNCAIVADMQLPTDASFDNFHDLSVTSNYNYGTDINYLTEVLNSIKLIISCTACFNCTSPMKECSNGHLICESCYLILRQLERPQCPICRVGLHSEPKNALIAENIMAELPEVCKRCHIVLSRKNILNHNEHVCPQRMTNCVYIHLGCQWVGTADDAEKHVDGCKIKQEKNMREIAEYVGKKEKTWNEIFQSFFSVLKRLESSEPQYRSVTLSFTKSTSDYVTFRSDQFHCNLSRWSLEVRFYQDGHLDTDYTSKSLGYRFTKENGIGNTRKFYGFVLLSIKCDENIKISLRPQLNFVKFANRGQITEFYTAINVDQKIKPRNYHIMHVDIGIIRKNEDRDD